METDARGERVREAYEAVHAPLWRAVLAYSGSADVADEAVAEAFAHRRPRHLTDQQRACIVLCDLAGHDAPSAARLLGTTGATVRVQLMRSRRRLRELLEDLDD